jgi:hypothetical protein
MRLSANKQLVYSILSNTLQHNTTVYDTFVDRNITYCIRMELNVPKQQRQSKNCNNIIHFVLYKRTLSLRQSPSGHGPLPDVQQSLAFNFIPEFI